MKKSSLLILIILSVCTKIFGQNYYEINFEGTGVMEFDTDHKLFIDTTLNPNNIWQIGHPNKSVFTNAQSNPNAIVTDTLNSYPINDTSSFVLDHIADLGFSMPSFVIFAGQYYVNSDSLTDFGTIEFSPDNGTTWIDLITNTTYSNSINWYASVKPTLTGNSNGWKTFRVFIEGLGPVFNIQYGDTVKWRFTFISDAIQTNKDGLMFDSISVLDVPPIGIESINSGNSQINAYPNPVNDKLIIETGANEKTTIDIYDFNSRLVFSKNIHEKTNINVSGLDEGVYTLTIKTAERIINKKLVIVH